MEELPMIVGERLKDLREQKNLSQGDIEKRTGLLRCYISRVENGHTVPNVETLEKMARALEIPIYRLFTNDADVKKPNIQLQPVPSRAVNTKDERELRAFAKLLSRMDDKKRRLLLHMASKMAQKV
jgi:transcriptional regulator with XRE-family HTH domain